MPRTKSAATRQQTASPTDGEARDVYRLEVAATSDFVRGVQRDFSVEHRYMIGCGRYVFWLESERQALGIRDAFLCSTRRTCSVVVLTHADELERPIGGARSPLRIVK